MSVDAMSHVWKTSQQKGASLLVLLAIADHAHADGTGSYPSTATLARMARTDERNVRRILGKLVESGEVKIDRRPGKTTEYVIPMVGSQVMPWADARRRPDASAPPDRSAPRTSTPVEPSGTRTSETSEGKDGSGGTGAPPDRSAPLLKEQPSAPPRLTPRREAKRIEEEAVALWVRERKRCGRPRFTEAAATRGLRIAVRRALSAGHEWLDIATALTLKASEANANPWYADEWIAKAATQRQDREHEQRKIEERAQTERAEREQSEDDWTALEAKYPGLTRAQIAERELFAGVLKPMPEAPVRGSVVQLFGPRGQERTWGGGRVDSSERAVPPSLSREPAQGPAKLATGGVEGPVAREVTGVPEGYPEVLGPDRISLVPQDFACGVGQKCPRRGSRWVRLGPELDPLPCCRQCFDETRASQPREGVG